jgi:hypothetical protein
MLIAPLSRTAERSMTRSNWRIIYMRYASYRQELLGDLCTMEVHFVRA